VALALAGRDLFGEDLLRAGVAEAPGQLDAGLCNTAIAAVKSPLPAKTAALQKEPRTLPAATP
jgi:hypothetical protein